MNNMGKMLVLVGFMFMAACADPGKSGEASVCSGTFVPNYNELLKRGKVSVEDAKRLDELFPAANAEVKLSAEEIKAKATALNESGWAEVIRRSANETLAICEKMFRSHGEKFACQGKTDKGWLESATADEVRSKVCNPSKLSLKRLDDLKTLAQ